MSKRSVETLPSARDFSAAKPHTNRNRPVDGRIHFSPFDSFIEDFGEAKCFSTLLTCNFRRHQQGKEERAFGHDIGRKAGVGSSM